MKVTCLGAAREVTGSKHLIETNGNRILFDCGMFQGRRKEADEKNRAALPIRAAELDAVVLSHAHIDHCGLLPLLRKEGFDGPIYSTPATRDLCSVMLLDSANIQQRDVKWLRKKKRSYVEPLYDTRDAQAVLRQFVSVPYGRLTDVGRGARFRFYDAGHILGSAITEFAFDENGETRTLVYSGDIGRTNHPMLNDPNLPPRADYVMMESTYGDREQETFEFTEERFADIVRRTYDRGGKVIIPSFALERAQEIVYVLKLLEQDNVLPPMPVFVDSPMAVNITEVFRLHTDEFDDEFADLMAEEGDPFYVDGIRYVRDVQQSIAINDLEGPCIIISASGMCENGRIQHHLRNHSGDERNTILIVGYQAAHTLGRRIVDGETNLHILGDEITLRADVEIITAFSCHAGQSELIQFAEHFGDARKLLLVHGEDEAMAAFADTIRPKVDAEILMPERGVAVALD